MTTVGVASVAVLVLALAGCETPPRAGPLPPTKGFPTSDVRESVYLPLERSAPVPQRYGLYTVLLTRAANRNTNRLLSELFKTTGGAGDAALSRENLNLILIPVKSAPEAARALALARNEPDPTAAAVTQKFYDYGQAVLLMANVCRPERGAAVSQVCGSAAPDGPLLVTTQRPLEGAIPAGERLLVVNLSSTPAEAIPEVMAAYRRQVMRRDFDSRDELDGWRLQALNHLIAAAQLLPGISKAYAVGK